MLDLKCFFANNFFEKLIIRLSDFLCSKIAKFHGNLTKRENGKITSKIQNKTRLKPYHKLFLNQFHICFAVF